MTPVRNVRVRLIAGLDLIGSDEVAAALFMTVFVISMILVAVITGAY